MPIFITQPFNKSIHDRSKFDCGIHELDKYLKERANADSKNFISKTYVFTEPNDPHILGFYTISNASLSQASLQAGNHPRYPELPACIIGRLAIHKDYQGKSLGKKLLVDALKRIQDLSNVSGVYAVLVDAKDQTAKNFYLHFGFKELQDDPLSLYMLVKDIPVT